MLFLPMDRKVTLASEDCTVNPLKTGMLVSICIRHGGQLRNSERLDGDPCLKSGRVAIAGSTSSVVRPPVSPG